MRRALKNITAMSLALAAIGCSAPALEVNVITSANSISLDHVSRYRVVVRQWCDDYPSVAQDVAPASSIDVSTAVVPGAAFYVWIQAWEPCDIPSNICPDEILAADNECRCVEASPRYQKLIAEGCTPWVTLAEGEDRLDVMLTAPTSACPPVVNEACP